MTVYKKVDMAIDQRFDSKACRHTINGQMHVLHCHHYATLYCQLADDAKMFDGKTLLRKAAEISFVPMLKRLMEDAGVSSISEKVTIVEDYWRFSGMGLLTMERVGGMSASAVMTRSHVDEGWIKKWGKRNAPVNFIGQGYLNAAMAAIYDLPIGSYSVQENQSIVSGAEASLFSLFRS